MPKEAIVHSSLESLEIIDSPIPSPKAHEVIIKVAVAGTNPKDWKYPLWKSHSHNSGDDMSGTIHSIGLSVHGFKPGDRVAAYHETGASHGSFASYSVAPEWSTFHIPDSLPFEEAATIPLCALTAAVALYADMGLPTPYAKRLEEGRRVPLVIYGVSTAVGSFAAKLARLSGIGPIIGIAGRAGSYASTLVDHVIDYRDGEEAILSGVEKALGKEGLGPKAPFVLDAISEKGSIETCVQFLNPSGGVISTVLPTSRFALSKEKFEYPDGVTGYNSAVPDIFTTKREFGFVWSRYIGWLLREGKLVGHPYEIVEGGLRGVLEGLNRLRNGEASAVKFVYRVEDTPEGLGRFGEGGLEDVGEEKGKGDHEHKDFPFPGNE